MSSAPVRWLFGDQLGPHFLDDHEGPVLMVESKAVFRRRRFHRAKAHLVLSAMRHRAAELGERVTYVRSEGYAEAVREHVGDSPVEVVHPTSYAALGLVERLAGVGPEGPTAARLRHSREDFERGWGWSEAAADGGLLREATAADVCSRAVNGGGRWN